MDERAFFGIFNGADNQGSLLLHPESPYQPYWGSEAWTPSRPDEIHDIGSMSPSLVDASSILSFDQGVLNIPVPGDEFAAAAGNSRFSQHEPWMPNLNSVDLYQTQDVQEMLNNPFLPFNPSTLGMPHLPLEYNINKSFGTVISIQPNRQVTSTTAPSSQYGGSSMVPNSRAVAGIDSPMSQYGSSPVVQNSMAMFAPTIPRGGNVSTPSLGGGMNSNTGLMHLPRRHNTISLAPKTGGDLTASDVGSGSGIAALSGASSFPANQKSSASVLMPLADSSHMHKMDTACEEPKRSSFNPGPYVNSVVPTPKQQHDQQQQQQQDSTRMWGDGGLGKSSNSVAIPNMGLRKQQPMCNSSPATSLGFDHMQAMSNSSPGSSMAFDHRHPPSMSNSSPVPSFGIDQRHQQQSLTNSSPVTNIGLEQRRQQAMSNSSPVTNIGLEQRRQQAMSNSSPATHFGIEQRPKPPMGSSPIPIVGFEPKQQHQRLPSSSPIPSMGFEQQLMSNSSSTPSLSYEQRQQPAVSTSPPLSNLSFEPGQPHQQPHQQPVSSAAPFSALVSEPRRPPTNLTSLTPPSIPNLSRQQPSPSNPRSTVPDSGDSVSKWPPLRIAGGLGGSTGGLSGSEKAPMMMQQPETGTLKCPLPRNISAITSPAANPAIKRPLNPDDTKNQGGSMTKRPLNKWQGPGGCSRLEEISNAAHQKVTQTTGGRALGPALNTNLKPRARQGSANDPQSIAARVRRERISERLKVLQALIPNGDKVDMVTMLEKAINYVRCLELQIRMLKNDSLWPKALGPLPATLQELLELAGPDFQDEKEEQEETPENTTKTTPEVIEMDGNQPSADKE